MQLPKVSIIVPVYNTEIYLKECIISLLNQTYKDIEIICINDGSKDKSADIIEQFIKLDNRLILINQENQGVAAARNTGLKAVTGEYVMFCDSDDFFQWDAIERCVKECVSHHNCDAVLFNARMFTKNGENITALCGEPYDKIPQKIEGVTSNYLSSFVNVCFGMFSSGLIQKHKIQFREGYIYEDWEFTAHFLSIAKTIRWLNINLYNYRWEQNTSISGNISLKCLDIFTTWEITKEYFTKTGRWENNQYSFYIRALGHILYFRRDRLTKATEDVKKAFDDKASKFIQAIPYVMLCSLARFFPMADRIALLKLHEDHDIEIKFCQNHLRRQQLSKVKQKTKNLFKKIMMKIFPAYRVAVNSRNEMEQMHNTLMSKLNEITWLQYENRKDINLIFRKLGLDKKARLEEEISLIKENEDYIE